jgi:hypothetical protein
MVSTIASITSSESGVVAALSRYTLFIFTLKILVSVEYVQSVKPTKSVEFIVLKGSALSVYFTAQN